MQLYRPTENSTTKSDKSKETWAQKWRLAKKVYHQRTFHKRTVACIYLIHSSRNKKLFNNLADFPLL